MMKTYPYRKTTRCHITAAGSYVRVLSVHQGRFAHSCLRQLCGTRWLAVLCIAVLLQVGCSDESPSNKQDNAQPDLTTDLSSNGPYNEQARTIPVADAAAITALRSQAAAEGKVLVVDCWATWCGSCVAMFPKLHEAMKERGDGVILVSLSFDEGEDLAKKAAAFLTKRNAWDNAYIAAPGSDATDAIAKALSDNWSGGPLPAVFVYKPDGTTAYELLETRGEVADWVAGIAAAVDQAINDAQGPPGE